MKFQRYIRVKNAPISSFKQERLPYEIVGGNIGISIGSRIAEDFEPFKANIKMPFPGVLDILGTRSYIQDVEAFGNLHKLLFEELGYEKGYNLLYEIGFRSAKMITKGYFEKFKIDISSPTTNVSQLIEKFMSYPTLRGYGHLELLHFDEKKNLIRVKLTDSILISKFAGFGKPVDAYIAGTIAGIVGSALEEDVVCKQTMCQAKGDDYCEFEVRPA
jgi:predicted hydrocarbon binding protein